MTIKEEFGHVVIGTGRDDVESSLLQILRPEINLATAYNPFSQQSVDYFHAIDIEKNFIKAGVGRDSGYGRDVAVFWYTPGKLMPSSDNVLPDISGLDAVQEDLYGRAVLMSKITGHDEIQVMIRLLGAGKDNMVTHIDNSVTYRGLQTIIGDGRTLFLPNRYVDLNKFHCEYDEIGEICCNGLKTDFRDKARHLQMEEHHMSIHKGNAFPNPLFHSAPGNMPELGFVAGTRALATFDVVEPN